MANAKREYFGFERVMDEQGRILIPPELRKALDLKPKVRNLWPRMIKYSAAACIVGLISFGGYHYYEYNQTVSLGNSQYLAYVSDISEMNSFRGTTDKTIRKDIEDMFANVKESRDIKNTIEKLESMYRDSFTETSVYNEFQDDISWNLAIAYLKIGEREKPIPILEGMLKRNVGYPQITQPIQNLIDLINNL